MSESDTEGSMSELRKTEQSHHTSGTHTGSAALRHHLLLCQMRVRSCTLKYVVMNLNKLCVANVFLNVVLAVVVVVLLVVEVVVVALLALLAMAVVVQLELAVAVVDPSLWCFTISRQV